MKKILSLIVALMLLFCASSAFASSIPDIGNKENCVVDMADVISQETEDYLSELNGELSEKTGASIVIATVDFTGSLPINEYAYEAFNKWQIGDKDKDNGLLLLMAIGQEDYFAVHGTGIEKALTAAELDQMLWEYLEDDFAAEDYDAGAKSFYLAAYEWFGDYYDVNLLQPSGSTDDLHDHEEDNVIYEENRIGMGRILMWIMLIVVVIILIAAFSDNKSQPKKVYRQKTHQRRGPHTVSYRRVTPPPARKTSSFSVHKSTKSSSTTRSSSRSTSTGSSSTRSSSSRSSSRSGGFGGGSTRGGGAGRRK